jgi:hypothetical protein
MTGLLSLSFPGYCGARTLRRTIGQECDANVTLPREVEPSRANDADLVLLDDAGIGHAGGWEKQIDPEQTAR